jgi:hypothetical protein
MLCFNPPCIKKERKMKNHNQCNARSYASIPHVFKK